MNSLDEMKARRQWFDSYLAATNADGPTRSICGANFTCPCCGYPTLNERGGYDICELCNWEDDGQDDPNADEVFGGPNKDYSLTQARHNFCTYLVKYNSGEDTRIGGADSDEELAAKRLMMHAFDQMHIANNPTQDQLCSQIKEGSDILYSETKRKIREFENR